MTDAIIAGIDEAGRGALAGPVVAGACILPADRELPAFIRDSKTLDAEMRERAFLWIQEHCIWAHGQSSAEEVDVYGILTATEKAMQQAVSLLAVQQSPTYLLVDGRDAFWFDYPHSSIIKGDQREPCISAASIVAKVVRDRHMIAIAKEYPQYAFETHKGYGTPEHCDLLRSRGLCPIHRQTFTQKILSDLVASTVELHKQ